MRDDHEKPDQFARVLARPATTPKPPPPMPTVIVPAGSSAPASAKPAEPPKGWEIDPDQLSAFTHAVESVRDRLKLVQAKVERMRAENFMPKLGTSPVGVALEEKFTDRLDAPLDDPKSPTTGGLRPMLAEAMRRMEEFVAGAESAVRAYREHDAGSAVRITTTT